MRFTGQATRGLMVLGLTMMAIVVQQVPASATFTTPYSGSGYDSSYPQCAATAAPSGFAIIGVGHGRPFTTNSCAGAEWAQAGSAGSLYFNTGYAMAYQKDVTANCQTASASVGTGATGHESSLLQTAWAIGCSEVDWAVASAPGVPVAWWADIETGNSWSTDKTVNQYTVDGLSYEMQQPASGVAGVYSSPSSWDKIVGSGFAAYPPFAGDWGPTLSCASPSGFDRSPVWIVQSGTSSGVDLDTGCG